MSRKLRRGKQQVLFHYLPGRTFDLGRHGIIARVGQIRGALRTDLNLDLILRAIEEELAPWQDAYRPAFRGTRSSYGRVRLARDSFTLLEPRALFAEMFPLVFWCQREGCNQVLDRTNGVLPNSSTCPACQRGRLVQLRWIRVHRCGAIEPLIGYCVQCQSGASMALETRGSERIAGFRWICRRCHRSTSLFGERCRACAWPDPAHQNMDIEVHRARRTYYSHHVVLLNQPGAELGRLLASQDWPYIVGAAFCDFPEVRTRTIVDLITSTPDPVQSQPPGLSQQESERLRARGFSDDQIAQFRAMQAELQAERAQAREALSPGGLARTLLTRTGLSLEVWQRAGQELLEALMPLQSGTVRQLFDDNGGASSQDAETQRQRELARRLGCRQATLITDFPITTATYGYSRVDYQPNTCRLNPFPVDPDHGRFPIFVDVIQADAIMLRLDATRVCRWLELNGLRLDLTLTSSANDELTRRVFFVGLFDNVNLRETIKADSPAVRMVLGLLHTFSHLTLRKAALLCGLDHTSLSEYVLPRALSWALYCNHRFGATIGALVALFEQSLAEWLGQILNDARRCVYDPVCANQGGNCHACVQLAETSCRFFNLNLARSFLFSGPERELGSINVGFLDPRLST